MEGYGNVIILNHGYGYETLYARIQKFNIAAGQQIKYGDIIGFFSSTGLSSRPHLFYEVHKTNFTSHKIQK